jgi:hypothetical protein
MEGNVNFSGKKTPLQATSIIPLEKSEPIKTPSEATVKIAQSGATLEPILELRKLTASLATPIIRSKTAKPSRTMTIIK